MRNTGMEYQSHERTPAVEAAFSELLPPLTDEQLSLLEADILRNGCYAPVIVNEDMVIVDGHNRYAICEKHGLPYRMAVFSFVDDLEAREWALSTQKSRRNLSVSELCKIAMKLRPEVEARAKERKADNGGDKVSEDARAEMTPVSSPLNKSSVRKELADAVGIGEVTMGRAMKIEDEAPQNVKDAVDSGDITIGQGYSIMRELQDFPEDKQEAAAAEAIIREIEKHNNKRRRIDADAKVAKLYCAAFEKGVQIEPTEANIRIWIENAGVKYDHLDSMIRDARQIADAFSTIADVLENTIKQKDWRADSETEENDTEGSEADYSGDIGK